MERPLLGEIINFMINVGAAKKFLGQHEIIAGKSQLNLNGLILSCLRVISSSQLSSQRLMLSGHVSGPRPHFPWDSSFFESTAFF